MNKEDKCYFKGFFKRILLTWKIMFRMAFLVFVMFVELFLCLFPFIAILWAISLFGKK